jgi:anti-sigma-K factor RskA
MTDPNNQTPLREDDILIAAEYVLRLLEPAEHASAETRVANDAAFAAEVNIWEERLRPLLAHPAENPPAQVLDRIMMQLPERVAAAPLVAANDTGARSLRWWQGIAGAAIAASLVLSVILLNQPSPMPIPSATNPAQAPVMVAALAAKTGQQAMTARYDPGLGELLITPVGIDTQKLYPELWIINAAGDAKSLGIVAHDHASRIIVAPTLRERMTAGATLAITAEPAGGAPGGKATGPVIVIGEMRTL